MTFPIFTAPFSRRRFGEFPRISTFLIPILLHFIPNSFFCSEYQMLHLSSYYDFFHHFSAIPATFFQNVNSIQSTSKIFNVNTTFFCFQIDPAYANSFCKKSYYSKCIFWNCFSRIYNHSTLQSKKKMFKFFSYLHTNSSYRKIPLNVSALICMLLQFIDRIILPYFTTFVIILQKTRNVMKNVFLIVYVV